MHAPHLFRQSRLLRSLYCEVGCSHAQIKIVILRARALRRKDLCNLPPLSISQLMRRQKLPCNLHFGIRNPKLSRMRPVPLVVSSLWWGTLSVVAFAYATYIDLTLNRNSAEGKLGMGILAVLFFMTCALLWFLWSYWQGQEWTRAFVIVGLILKALYYLRQAGHIYRFPHGFEDLLLSLRVLDFVFSIYMLYWLMSKEARSYFALHARTN
jgi:hypothetical protein